MNAFIWILHSHLKATKGVSTNKHWKLLENIIAWEKYIYDQSNILKHTVWHVNEYGINIRCCCLLKCIWHTKRTFKQCCRCLIIMLCNMVSWYDSIEKKEETKKQQNIHTLCARIPNLCYWNITECKYAIRNKKIIIIIYELIHPHIYTHKMFIFARSSCAMTLWMYRAMWEMSNNEIFISIWIHEKET